MSSTNVISVRVLRRFTPEFSSISFVFELENGRVVVADKKDRVLYLVGKDGAGIGRIGRSGDGPGEYRNPANGFAFGADSAIVIDAQNSKWYLLVGSQLFDVPSKLRELQRKIGNRVDGISRNGDALSLLGVANGSASAPARQTDWVGHADSVMAVAFLITGKPDTIARLHGDFSGQVMVSARMNGVQDNFKIANPLSTYDQAVMFVDGSVAIAHHAPYRVDWKTAGGKWIFGREVREPPQAVTATVRSLSASGYLRNRDGSAVLRVDQFPGWPKLLPPFLARSLLPGSDGFLYVRRTKIHPDDVQIVDVFDRNGGRIRQIRLPLRSRLVGTGRNGLYVAVRDMDDVEHLLLYDSPVALIH